jgi:metal-dependent amidase/aminoacylase/carboxypeptidase family protein
LPYSIHYPVTYNDPQLTAAILPSLERAAGKENVKLVPPETGSEDFSFFAREVPGFFFYIGGLTKGRDAKTSAPHHTPEFVIDDAAFTTGLKAFCHLVIDYGTMNKK